MSAIEVYIQTSQIQNLYIFTVITKGIHTVPVHKWKKSIRHLQFYINTNVWVVQIT
jgi:hypothetical protein